MENNELHELMKDAVELLLTLEKATEELRSHNNDNQGLEIISKSLKLQKYFLNKYNIVLPESKPL